MPINSAAVGRSIGPAVQQLDPRWLMSYAAGIGETAPVHFDTTQPGGIVGHPVFPVCPEWDLARLGDEPLPGLETLQADELVLGVHYDQRIQLHRPLVSGQDLSLKATVTGVATRRSGSLHLLQFEAVDPDGRPLWTSIQGALFRDTAVLGDDRLLEQVLPPPARLDADLPALQEEKVDVAYNAPHVYTECSHIWNPIHTDEAVARGAGLPGIILHGTATLALAVSAVLRMAGNAGPADVRDLYGRFAAMVPLPDTLSVRILLDDLSGDVRTLRFDVRNGAGEPAIRDGLLVLGPVQS